MTVTDPVRLGRMVAGLVEKVEHRFYGKYRGIVVDNEDPARLGRLRLSVPSVLGADVVTGWATPCSPYGGAAGQGFLFIPERQAGVWVEFEEGDLEFPIWVGTYWTRPDQTSQLPRPQGEGAAEQGDVQQPVTRKIVKTLKGHTIQFEDADSAELVTIVEAVNGNVITLDASGITITDGANGHRILLDGNGITITDGVTAGNSVTLGSGGVVVDSPAGVRIGGNANQPFVLGTQFSTAVQAFMTALKTHTHVGNLGAPTSPPTPLADLTVPLSQKHMVE